MLHKNWLSMPPTRGRSADLKRAIASVRTLSLEELRRLKQWLHARITAKSEKEANRVVLEEVKTPTGTYRRELVKCGKSACKCAKADCARRRNTLTGRRFFAMESFPQPARTDYCENPSLDPRPLGSTISMLSSTGPARFRLTLPTASPFGQDQTVLVSPLSPALLTLPAGSRSFLGPIALVRGDFSGLQTTRSRGLPLSAPRSASRSHGNSPARPVKYRKFWRGHQA
jgi:hypothetical protein